MRFPDLDGLFIYCVWDADTQRGERKRSPLDPDANIMPWFAVALCVGTCRVGGNPMTLIMAEDEVLSAAIAGVPKVAEFIAAVPTVDRSRAVEAAEKSYLRTAFTLGYQDAEAQQWVSAVMSRLRLEESDYMLRMLASPPTSPN